jgi:hypothetical protein
MSEKLHNYFKQIKGYILGSGFIKSVLTLSSGIVISQILSMVTTPVISRIYDPQIMGEFGLITSNSALIIGIVTLGMMTAIMLPKEDMESRRLCNLIFFSVCSLSTIIFLILIAIKQYYKVIDSNVNYTAACSIMYFFIILSQLSAIYYAYTNRLKKYKVLFWNPIINSITYIPLAIIFGLLGYGLAGYCIANLLSTIITIIHMGRHVKPFTFEKEAWQFRSIRNLLKAYQKFPKYQLPAKMFGVYEHTLNRRNIDLFRGFDDEFYVPHSRHTEVKRQDIERIKELEIFSESEESGVYIVGAKGGRQIFITGHSEYDPLTLKSEYDRDIGKGLEIAVPKNYFPGDDPTRPPIVRWRAHANLLYANWLNYYVYQETPFDLEELK